MDGIYRRDMGLMRRQPIAPTIEASRAFMIGFVSLR